MYVLQVHPSICQNIDYLVKHVHYLRVRALKLRWEEEKILLNYEMQWTVRFFKNMAEKWKLGAESQGISNGAKAYALRHESRWGEMAVNSDKIFKYTSTDYVAPII
jgi:hypothetical protein